MKSTTVWETQEIENSVPSTDDSNALASRDKLKLLKQLSCQLLREVQTIGEVQTMDVESGLDFYDEVTRFEIDLITRALLHCGGHQSRAARLLNLKVTTLNSKIKHYNIQLDAIARGFPFVDTAELESRTNA